MPRTVDPALVEQYEEKKKRRQMSSQAVGDDDGRVAQRILAQRRMEGGKRYLVHWRGRTVAQATGASRGRLSRASCRRRTWKRWSAGWLSAGRS